MNRGARRFAMWAAGGQAFCSSLFVLNKSWLDQRGKRL
tara:strand:- start:304 stop:417 length:114 start_codon:yes stop_codon:yes gene_type:complete